MKKGNTRVNLIAAVLFAAIIFLIFWHEPNPTQEERNAKLKAYFESYGFSITVSPMEKTRTAPIYKPSAWESWKLNGEELLVYFDESNRADYLAEGVDESFGFVTRFGLRFVLVYQGNDEKVIQALRDIPKDEMD